MFVILNQPRIGNEYLKLSRVIKLQLNILIINLLYVRQERIYDKRFKALKAQIVLMLKKQKMHFFKHTA